MITIIVVIDLIKIKKKKILFQAFAHLIIIYTKNKKKKIKNLKYLNKNILYNKKYIYI